MLLAVVARAQELHAAPPGGPDEPVRVTAPPIDLSSHDGGLRPAIGVENIQVMRANRTQPETADGFGWTYSHAPMLAHWNGMFLLEYLSNPYGEHVPPGQTLLVTSRDGREWNPPVQVFPIYLSRPGPISGHDSGMAIMHQRMGFYVAPNGRLLVSGHYGQAPSPMGDTGIGRVVREVKRDGTFGPIYFVRYNSLAGRNEKNTPRFPFYLRSPDAEFVAACEALLADRLKTLQWREEDRSADGFYSVSGPVLQAPSVYHRADGTAVALWKESWGALSTDEGRSWSTPVILPTLITGGAKTWGQRTSDGRFALVYNPAKKGRWPLAVTTSDDGITFGELLLVNGEVPPRRFFGRAKDFGMQYVRGIAEGNGRPPDGALWVTYSSNKEDMWVSRVPVPVRSKVSGPVHDTFDAIPAGGPVPDWNIYRPRWAEVAISPNPSAQNKCLRLSDRDPYDHATAVRVFAEATTVQIEFSALVEHAGTGRLEIEILDAAGRRPVRIALREDGRVWVLDPQGPRDVAPCTAGSWHRLGLAVDARRGTFDLSLDQQVVLRGAALAEPVTSVERLSFRTGEFRTSPRRDSDRYGVEDLSNPDRPVPLAAFCIDDVDIR